MHEEVKKFADGGDIKSLKYIFVDCLDIDPTFEEYLDDYNYCVKKGLFERHEQLRGMTDRQADWNDNYWQILKRDLLKNFSHERLDHMRKVAPVVLANKVARLKRERQQQTRQTAAPPISQPIVQQRPATPPLKSKAEQDRELEAERQKLAQEKAAIEQQQQEAKRRRQENLRRQSEVIPPKKSLGIAPLIAVIAAVLAVIIYNLLK